MSKFTIKEYKNSPLLTVWFSVSHSHYSCLVAFKDISNTDVEKEALVKELGLG